MNVFDDTTYTLGEGPLWHPECNQLFWFDILGNTLHTREDAKARSWRFDENVSAAGWVSEAELLIASETRLFRFDIESGASEDILPLEADIGETRSNDGRADPWGGFWIGTMHKDGGVPAGSIYRFYQGEVTRLFDRITIPNAICFSPDRAFAYFCDTSDNLVKRVALDADGWPKSDPLTWLDLSGEPFGCDGAVIDAEGNFWNAQWGAWRVACYNPEGVLIREEAVGAAHSSCPAFGGPELTTLFCTSAADGTTDEDRARSADQGKLFFKENVAKGQAEHRVIL